MCFYCVARRVWFRTKKQCAMNKRKRGVKSVFRGKFNTKCWWQAQLIRWNLCLIIQGSTTSSLNYPIFTLSSNLITLLLKLPEPDGLSCTSLQNNSMVLPFSYAKHKFWCNNRPTFSLYFGSHRLSGLFYFFLDLKPAREY